MGKEKIELELVEIISIEDGDFGDCVILDLIIPPGPFKKEDIVRLPIIYAKTLIMKNAADRVDLPNL